MRCPPRARKAPSTSPAAWPRSPEGLPSALADPARRGPERPSPGPAAGRGGRQAVRQLVRSGGPLFEGWPRLVAEVRTRYAELVGAARAATAATAEFGEFLRRELPGEGGRGPDRYALASQYFLGATVDPQETYAWGCEELHRLADDMPATAAASGPAPRSPRRSPTWTPTRPAGSTGKEAFRDWMQELADRTIAELADPLRHPRADPAHRVPASRRPTTARSTTPGRRRTSAGPAGCGGRCRTGIDDFATWQEVTTVYHEGVPGHHLQVGRRRPPRTASTAGSGCCAGSPATARAGPCTPSG